ncbi:MAG: protein kinase, partial [Anaerolineae bacterium]|nr:protein kinase [Anaerolineae bacterium]
MDLSGTTLGKYKLTERLGSGGMAEVYKAFQSGVERDVAIKVMHRHLADSADFRERFHREARAIGQLQHPNIVNVIDFDEAHGDYYMVMNFLSGGTLHDYLSEENELPLSEALSIASRLCDALSYAHKRGMIHRDIKPANVMFSDKARTRVILTDFGMARLKNEAKLTVSGTLLGTPAYMPPEVIKGEPADHRADLYSLAAVLYEMVTGRTPHVADTPYGVLIKQANDPLPLPSEFKPDIEPALEAFLVKALAKDPNDRFADAQEMLEAIKKLDGSGATTIASQPVIDHATVATPAAKPEAAKSKKWLVIGGVLIGIVVIAGLGMMVFNAGTGAETSEPAVTVTGVSEVVAIVETETAVPTPTTVPTIEPTPLPEIIEEAPTTAVATTEPTAEPVENLPEIDIAQQAFSVLDINFSNQPGQSASTFTFLLDHIQLPAPETNYILWFVSESGQRSLGVLPPDGRLSLPLEGSNVTDFSSFVISMEPSGTVTEISGPIIYEKTLPDDYRSAMATLLNDHVTNADAQLAIAQAHTGFLRDELANGNLAIALVHAEHVINILDGADGADFGDLDGDGSAQNPGNDVGVRVHLESAIDSANAAREAVPPSHFSQGSAEKTVRSLENSIAIRSNAQALALKLFATDTAAEAQPFADELELLLQQLREGSDNDGNGVVDALAGEGGITAVYENGLSWLARSYVAENGANSAENSPVGTLKFAPDSLTLTLNDVPLPPVGTDYYAWLLNESTGSIALLGSLPVANNQIHADFPADEQTFSQHDRLVVSLEETAGSEPTGTAVYIGGLSPETNAAVTSLLTPDSGLTANLMGQTGLAIDHAGFMLDDLAAGNLEGGKRHAEHMVNILVGEGAPEYGDLDNSGLA